MKRILWPARIAVGFSVLLVMFVGAVSPASASTHIPTGYVLGSAEWCNFDKYRQLDLRLYPGPGTLHLRARHNMANGEDGICAYVTDDVAGSHWINVRVKASAWSTSAWDADTYSTYAGAIGLHAALCFDTAYGEVTVDGVTSSITYSQLWCTF